MGDIFWAAKILNIFRALEIPDFFVKCRYVNAGPEPTYEKKNRVTPPPPPGLGLACSNIQNYYKLRPEIMRVLGLPVQISLTFLYMTAKPGLRLLCTQSLKGLV